MPDLRHVATMSLRHARRFSLPLTRPHGAYTLRRMRYRHAVRHDVIARRRCYAAGMICRSLIAGFHGVTAFAKMR